MSSSPSTSIVGASVSEQELYDYVSAHVEQEKEIVDEYRRLAASDDRAFGFLATVILEDEERHHKLFADLADSIRKSAELLGAKGPIPSLVGLGFDRTRLATTERFLEVEKADLRELKELEKRLKDFKNTTLWSLLVQIMRDDTEKHIRILSFIRDRLRDAR
jgi:bacterioferritin (cytochrome b1)